MHVWTLCKFTDPHSKTQYAQGNSTVFLDRLAASTSKYLKAKKKKKPLDSECTFKPKTSLKASEKENDFEVFLNRMQSDLKTRRRVCTFVCRSMC